MTHLELPDEGPTPCQTEPGDLWFPEPGSHNTAERAKTLCKRSCPTASREACLAYALNNRVTGIWGGTDGDERKDIRKARGITPAAVGISTTWARAETVLRMHDRGNPFEHISRVTGLNLEWVRTIVRNRRAS